MMRSAAVAVIGLGLMSALSAPAGAGENDKPAAAAGDYPRPSPDPAAIARGKQAFSVNCAFCHGSAARGGESGPNLLRSPLLLNDQQGEVIGAFIQVGRPEKGMPKFSLPADTAADIAAFLHSIPVGRGAADAFDPNSILVGKPARGKAFFNGAGGCSGCHSLKGDLAHIGSRLDAKTLQDNIVSGGATTMLGFPLPSAPAQTVSVTPASGPVVTGTLVDVDDFHVTLTDPAGNRHTFLRDGPAPKVEIRNPLQAHLDRVRQWDDADLHNVTAFLKSQQ